MSLETQKKQHKQKYTLQPKTKTLSGARANGFGRQLIQKIRSIQKKNPNAEPTTDVVAEREKKATKKGKKQKEGLQNPAFDPFYTNAPVEKHTLDTIEENEDENLVKDLEKEIAEMTAKKRKQQEEKPAKTKKRKRESVVGFVNNGLDLLEGGEGGKNNTMEVKRGGGLTNPAFEEPLLDATDLILNVTTAPPPPPQQSKKTGYVNRAFNAQNNPQQQQRRVINARNIMENCGAEVENDINEKRYPMVGEMDGSEGENERVEEGTKLRYKYATFSHRTPWYHYNMSGPKKSYKHLIKGDIILAFKNTNLHEIQGYAARKLQNNGGRGGVRRVATSLRRTAVVKPASFVTRSRAVPLENGVRRAKPFVGYNSQQFVKSRVPRFQNQRFCHQGQNFGVNRGNFGPSQQNFNENQGNFGPYQENFELNEENFDQNQKIFDENYDNFVDVDQNFDFDQGDFGQNQQNFDVNQGNFAFNQENFGQSQQNFGPHQPSFGPNQQNFAHQQNIGQSQDFRSNQQNFRQNQRQFGPNQQNFVPNQTNFRPKQQNFPSNQPNFGPNQFVPQQQNFIPQNQQFYPQNQPPQNFQQFPQNQQNFMPQQNQHFSPMQRPMKPRIGPAPQRNFAPNQSYNESPNGPFYNNQQGLQGGNGYHNQQFYPQNNQQYN